MKENGTTHRRHAIVTMMICGSYGAAMAKMPKGKERDKITAALEALLETQPDAEPSLLTQVVRHFGLIEKLRAQGHSFARIAEALRQVDMDISENTLMQYVGRLRRQSPGENANKPEPAAATKPIRAKPDWAHAVPKPAKGPAADRATHKNEELQSWMTDGPDETNI